MARHSLDASFSVLLIVFCSVTSQLQARHILQDDRAEAFLTVSFPEEDCDSQNSLGIRQIQDIWNNALNCSRCSVPYNLKTCDPHPVINYRISSRGIETSKIQEMLNTLIVHPSCILAQFKEYSTIQIIITKDLSPSLYVLPSWALYDRNITEQHSLLPNCYLLNSDRNDGRRVLDQEVLTQQSNSNDTNTTDGLLPGQLANIKVTFDIEDISLPGETTSNSETPMHFFKPLIPEIEQEQMFSIPQIELPTKSYYEQDCVGSKSFLGAINTPTQQAAQNPCATTGLQYAADTAVNFGEQVEEIAHISSIAYEPIITTADIDSTEPTLSFVFQNDSVEYCAQLQNSIQSKEFRNFFEQGLPCTNCTRFSILCIPNITLTAILPTSTPQNFFNTAYFTPSCILYDIFNNDIGRVDIKNLPPEILYPTTMQSDLSIINSCITQQQQILSQNGASYRRVQNNDGSVVLVKEEITQERKRSELEGIGEQEQEQGGGGGGSGVKREIWIPILVAALVLLALIVLVASLLLFRKQQSEEVMVSGGPGKQAVLFARAEQFGYTPTFRVA